MAFFLCSSVNATIINGGVTTGLGSFIKLSPGFTESTPNNTVGADNFNTLNLYGFDEVQNTTVTGSALSVDILASASGASGSLAIGTVVASHYIFFDPASNTRQAGFVSFDSDILAIITSSANLAASDYLINNGVTYLNPGLRGLEAGDNVVIDPTDASRVTVDWLAGSPGDYIRVLTAFSPDAAVPVPPVFFLFLAGLLGMRFFHNK